jgi:hypothetical protein
MEAWLSAQCAGYLQIIFKITLKKEESLGENKSLGCICHKYLNIKQFYFKDLSFSAFSLAFSNCQLCK